MAGLLGGLVVSLGLDAVEFTKGLTKAEYEAKKFAQQMDRAVAGGIIKAQIALEAAAAAARFATDAFKVLTTGAGDFADLAEKTGASAEGLASLAVSAATAGVSMEEIAGSANKLTKNLVGVDDESKAAGAALKALNINVADFKKLNPTEQYLAVGKALEGYADGAGKVAVAQALFGKSGAEQLRVFKALQEVGGAQVILTQKQIEQADAYADRQAKATAEIRLYAQAAATQAIPALTDLTNAGADLIKSLIGVGAEASGLAANNGVKAFAEGAVDTLAFAVDQLDLFTRLFQIAGKTIGGYGAVVNALARGSLAEAKAVGEAYRADLALIDQQITFSERIAKARAARTSDDAARRREDRGFTPAGKVLNFEGAIKAGAGGAKAARTFTDYASEVSQAVAKMVEEADVVRIAKLNDQLRELDKLQAAGLNSGIAADARASIYAKLPQQIESSAEAFRRLELAGSEAATKAFDTEKLDAFLDKQQRLDDLLGRSALKRQREDMLLLTEAFEAGEISVARYTELVQKNLGVLDDGVKNSKSLVEELGLTFTSAFEDAIVAGGSLSDVLKGLEKDLIRIITRKLITEPLGQAIGGADLGSLLGSFFGGGSGDAAAAIFGGGLATGGAAEAGRLYRVNERGPEVLDVGGKQFLMMGNQRGHVDPNPRLGGRSMSVYNQFTLTGPVDRRTQNQVAALAARGVAVANARLN